MTAAALKRRKDLERELPRSFRRCGDKARVYEDASGELMIVVGAKRRTEADMLRLVQDGLVMKRAADLLDAPAVGGFLHWDCPTRRRVLFFDGEMPAADRQGVRAGTQLDQPAGRDAAQEEVPAARVAAADEERPCLREISV